jgi:hypothetical protein
MRNFTLLLLALPSFMTIAKADDVAIKEGQYRRLAAQMACTKGCEQSTLRLRAEGMATEKADRRLSTCRMECSDAFNRTSSISAIKERL